MCQGPQEDPRKVASSLSLASKFISAGANAETLLPQPEVDKADVSKGKTSDKKTQGVFPKLVSLVLGNKARKHAA